MKVDARWEIRVSCSEKLLTHDTDAVGVKIPGLHVVCFA